MASKYFFLMQYSKIRRKFSKIINDLKCFVSKFTDRIKIFEIVRTLKKTLLHNFINNKDIE